MFAQTFFPMEFTFCCFVFHREIWFSPINLMNCKPICLSNISHEALTRNIVNFMLFTCGVQHGPKLYMRFCNFFFQNTYCNGHYRRHVRFIHICSKGCSIMNSLYMIKISRGDSSHQINTTTTAMCGHLKNMTCTKKFGIKNDYSG